MIFEYEAKNARIENSIFYLNQLNRTLEVGEREKKCHKFALFFVCVPQFQIDERNVFWFFSHENGLSFSFFFNHRKMFEIKRIKFDFNIQKFHKEIILNIIHKLPKTSLTLNSMHFSDICVHMHLRPKKVNELKSASFGFPLSPVLYLCAIG